MKRNIVYALVVSALSLPMMAQNKGNMPQKNEVKGVEGATFSYATAVLQAPSLRQYLEQRENVDSAFMKDVVRGLLAKHYDNKKAKQIIAYAAGLKIAKMNATNVAVAINQQATGNADTTYFALQAFNQGLADVLLHKPLKMDADSAQKVIEQQVEYAEKIYKAANEEWLRQNAKKEGVKQTPSGLQYRVIKEGKGELPTDTSTVKVNYEGRLINGKVFDSSYERNEPIEFKTGGVISGWTEALKMMPVGSTWEVFIPARLAYGERNLGKIPANSTLVFKIELLNVKH